MLPGTPWLNGDGEFYSCAFVGAGLPFTAATDFFKTFANVEKAVAGSETHAIDLDRARAIQVASVKPMAVIGYAEGEAGWLKFQ